MNGRTGTKPRRALAGSALAVAGALALLGPISACTKRSERAASTTADTRAVLIPVEGMSCAACAARVKKALLSIDGVSGVEVSLAERRARARFDPARVSPRQLVAAIEALGYRAGSPAEAP
jgi:Cu+-exporting ATPase